jgi:hypothetical protein
MRLDAFQPHPLKHMVFQVRFTAEDIAQLPPAVQTRMRAMLRHYRGTRVGTGYRHVAEALGVLKQAVQALEEA